MQFFKIFFANLTKQHLVIHHVRECELDTSLRIIYLQPLLDVGWHGVLGLVLHH